MSIGKTAIYIILIFFMVSCGLFQDKHPCEQYIDRQAMVNIVAEIFLLESYIATHSSVGNIWDSIPYYYASIFQKYGTDAIGFENALKCYLLDKDKMNLLMDDVLSTLSIAQSKAQEFPEQGRIDTLDQPEGQN